MMYMKKPPRGRQGQNKYGAVKTRGYDSAKEAERARELHLLERYGKISDLHEQVPFEIIPAIWLTPQGEKVPLWQNRGSRRSVFREPVEDLGEEMDRKGWKCIQRRAEYVADFVYKDADGRLVVEDVKGYKTDAYRLKAKLMLYIHGIEIREV